MQKTCGKCGGTLEAGITKVHGLIGGALHERQQAEVAFVGLGSRTSGNPIKAFQQGLSNEPSDQSYRINGYRCSKCGALDLYAEDVHGS